MVENYECLKNEIAYLHLQWELYQKLFVQEKAFAEVLEKYGIVFGLLQRLMINNFALSFMKLTSKEKILGEPQLCLKKLINGIDNYPSLSSDLNQIYNKFKNIGTGFKKHRDNRVAHNNLNIRIIDFQRGQVNTGFSIKHLREFFMCLQEFMNTFADYFNLSRPGYEDFSDECGRNLVDDIQSMLLALK